MFLAARKAATWRILEWSLALVKSIHRECLGLLLHFVLNFASPRYKGISNVTLKCIAKPHRFFLGLGCGSGV